MALFCNTLRRNNPVAPAKVLQHLDFLQSRLPEKTGDLATLPPADLQKGAATGAQNPWQVGRDRAVGVEAVRAREKRQFRIVITHLA